MLREKSPASRLARENIDELCRLMIGRDSRMLQLAEKYLTLNDLITIKSRLIGNGYVGGKSIGMLIAQKILQQDKSFDWPNRLEPHDSFYVGSEVFYSYIVENG